MATKKLQIIGSLGGGDGVLTIDTTDAEAGTANLINADTVGGLMADSFVLETEFNTFKSTVTSDYALKSEIPTTAAEVEARPSTWTPSADDVGALAKDAQAADSAKLGGNVPEYYMPDYGRGQVLWEGNWSSGTITVPDTSKYIGFQIFMTDIAATILAMRNSGNIRGIGGHASSESASLYSYHFSSEVSGNKWTLGSCRSAAHTPSGNHGSNNVQTVSKIVGLF